MKILINILIFTFAVYLGFAECSSSPPKKFDTGPITASWRDMNVRGMKVSVLRDPWTKKLIDIKLREGQQLPPTHPDMWMWEIRDGDYDLNYIAHKNADGYIVALSPVTDEYRKIMLDQRNRRRKVQDEKLRQDRIQRNQEGSSSSSQEPRSETKQGPE